MVTDDLRHLVMTAAIPLDRAMNGVALQAFIEQVLVLALVPSDIVVMDSGGDRWLQRHGPRGRRHLQGDRAGRCHRLLPSDSTDSNWTDITFAKSKAPLRACADRATDRLGLQSNQF